MQSVAHSILRFVLLRFVLLRFVRGIAAALLLSPTLCLAEPTADRVNPATDDELAFFNKEVLPILDAKCLKCHGGEKVRGGLRLNSRAGLLKGGESGPAIDRDDLRASLLIEAINYESFEMPPTGKIAPAQIATLTKWVEQGAAMPDVIEVSEQTEAEHGPPQVTAETKNHWAFRKLERPVVPPLRNNESAGDDESVENPIDAFIRARLDDAGLSPNPPADPQALVRRVYYDLTGLPPTLEQVEAFTRDPSDEAYVALIDELLASPRYGEHWARYWLDLVRYAESNSFERDDPKPYVWRYRDYVIRSFNDDKPYDQFLREQLAGDELDEVTADSIIATGYYRLGIWDDEPADPQLALYDELDDIIGTTGQVMLGLTLNCARCHDHKLDPIPTADYYSFLSFFRNIRRYGVRSEPTVFDASVRSISTTEEAEINAKRIAEFEGRLKDVERRLATIEAKVRPDFSDVEKEEFEHQINREALVSKRVKIGVIEQKMFDRYKRLRRERAKLLTQRPTGDALALCVKEHGPTVPTTHVLLRGNAHSEGDVVQPSFPQVLSPPPAVIPTPIDDAESSGRRRVLAEWIASPENPLTARVMANRLWQFHFGRGIVTSPNNFGLQGDRPSHPQLLDWLAAEFIERGWSLKQMHRLIMLSDTYRMSSASNEPSLAADPANDLFWRHGMRRLRAEEIRDSILSVNRRLNAEAMFGPSFYPQIPAAVLAGQSRPGANWGESTERQRARRSIYIHIKRSLIVPLLASFDLPETDSSCAVRFATTQPTQALGMLNSEFLNEQAAVFAAQLQQSAGDDRHAQVQTALSRTMQRSPTPEEIERGLDLITRLRENHGLNADQSLKYFCLLALNLNEFLYLD